MEKYVISARQFTIIVAFFAIGTSILVIPGSITGEVKQDAWIASILSVLVSLVLVKLFISVGNLSPDKSLVELNEKVLGKWVGSIVSISFVFFTYVTAGELLYFVSNFMNTQVMHDTPPIVFIILFALIIVFAFSLGLETFARSAEILFPIFTILFVILIFLTSPQLNVQHLQPVLEHGPKSILYSVLFFISIFSFPMVSLLMVFPVSINNKKEGQKGFYIGTIIAGIVLTILIILCILVLGENNTANHRFPSYTLAQRVSIGNIIERIEVIMAFMWIISIFFKTIIYYYAAVIGLGQILKVKDYRALNLPLGFILVLLAQFLHPTVNHSDIYNKEAWIPFAATYGIFFPLLLLAVGKLRKTSSIPKKDNHSELS